ncbi:MAG: hypothetical protein IPM13_01740 [Phycisphaerales bacterium]|nr:hypothetical protein [Phycisphaerales bacterium]
MSNRIGKLVAVGVALAFLAGVALGEISRVVYSTIPASPTSDVPGMPGVKFINLAGGETFQAPWRSENGRWWVVTARTTLATTEDEVILKGSELSASVLVREGTPIPWGTNPNALFGAIDDHMGVNNAGQVSFSTNLLGVGTAVDDVVVLWNGTTFVPIAIEGQPVPGFSGTEVYGAAVDSATVTNTGKVAFRASATVGALPTTEDDFLFLDDTIIAQSGLSIPTGQIGSQPWNLFNFEQYFMSADGTKWLAGGTLTGPTASDVILALNNNVVLQESVDFGGLPVASLSGRVLTPEGDWMARGSYSAASGGLDFVTRNGVLLIKTDDPVPGGLPGETFDDAPYSICFFAIATNAVGDYIYGGTTSNADVSKNAVIVFNGQEVLLREGDPVDVDGNGVADDNAYISIFSDDDLFLDRNGYFFFIAELRDDAGAYIGEAFLRVGIPICKGDMDCDGDVDFDDIDAFVEALGGNPFDWPYNCYWRAADCNDDGSVNFDDIDPFVALIGSSCN